MMPMRVLSELLASASRSAWFTAAPECAPSAKRATSALLGSDSIPDSTGTEASDPMRLNWRHTKSLPAKLASDFRKAMKRFSISRIWATEPCAFTTTVLTASRSSRFLSKSHLATRASKSSMFAVWAGAIGQSSASATQLLLPSS